MRSSQLQFAAVLEDFFHVDGDGVVAGEEAAPPAIGECAETPGCCFELSNSVSTELEGQILDRHDGAILSMRQPCRRLVRTDHHRPGEQELGSGNVHMMVCCTSRDHALLEGYGFPWPVDLSRTFAMEGRSGSLLVVLLQGFKRQQIGWNGGMLVYYTAEAQVDFRLRGPTL